MVILLSSILLRSGNLFPAFQDRHYINTFIERYRREGGYFELMPNDMI
jgi:hypothetical protein